MFKKLTSLLLSALILISSVSGALIVNSVADTTPTLEEYTETATNWYIEDSASSKLGVKQADSWAKATIDTSTDNCYNGTQSVKLHSKWQFATINLGAYIKPNTKYTLTFKYKSASLSTSGNYIMEYFGIYAKDYTGATFSGGDGKPGFISQQSTSYYYIHKNNNFAGSPDWASGRTTLDSSAAGKWQTAELVFYSHQYTNLTLVIKSVVDDVYIDGLELLVDPESYYETPANWKKNSDTATKIDSATATAVNAVCNSQVFTNGAQSLLIKQQWQHVWIPLNNIEANKHYKITFSYQVDALDTNSSAFDKIGIYAPDVADASFEATKKGFVAFANKDYAYYWKNNNFEGSPEWSSSISNIKNTKLTSADINTWQTMTFEFYSYSYTNLSLVFKTAATKLYLDGFEVSEVLPDPESYYETPANWKYDTDTATTISDFATAKSAKASQNFVTFTEGKQSVLIEQQYQNVWIPLKDIEANKHYKISFKYNLNALCYDGSGFEKIGVYAPDVDGASLKNIGGKGFVSYAQHDTSYHWKNNNFEGEPNWTASALKTKLEESDLNTWQTITLEFYSHSYTNLSLVFKIAASKLYLDGFEVSEVLPNPESYYETPANWKYDTDTATTISDFAIAKSAKASQNGATYTVGSQSVLIEQQYQNVWIPLKDIEANKHYKITLKYNLDALCYDGSGFEKIGVYAPDVDGASLKNIGGKGFVSYAQHDTSYHWKNNNFTGDPEWTGSALKTKLEESDLNTWQTITLEFYSHSYTNLSLVFKVAASKLYLDGFELTEVTSGTNPPPPPDDDEDTPQGPYTPESYFETESNWIFDAENATTVGSTTAESWVKATTNIATVKDGAQSLKINAPYRLMSIKLPDTVKTNTEYKLSFWYNASTLGTEVIDERTYYFGFRSISVFSAGVDGAQLGWEKKGTIVASSINGSYTTDDFATFDYGTQGTTALTEADAGVWKKAEIYFKTADFTDLYLVMKAYSQVYVDGFELTAMAPESYYEDPANWGFEDGEKSKTIGDEPCTWANATYSDYVAHNGKLSLKLHAPYQYSYIKLPDGLEPYTEYTLSFWQYTDSLGSNHQNDEDKTYYYGVRTYGIFTPDVKKAEFGWNKPGSITNISFNGSYMAAENFEASQAVWSVGGISTELNPDDAGKWHKLSITFKTQEYTNLHLLLSTYSDPIYLDDFEINEAPPHYTVYTDGPQRVIKLDFEKDYGFDYFQGDTIDVAETEGMDGKPTRAMHIKERIYDKNKTNVTVTNWNPIRTNTDPILTMPVVPNTLYEVSVKVKVEKWKNPNIQSSLYIYYDYANEKNIAIPRITDIDGKGWIEYSVQFTTKEHMKWVSFGVNAGNEHPEMWFDDVVLKQFSRGYIEDVEDNYCLDYFNILDDMQFATSGNITSETTFKIPVKKLTRYTLGANLSGDGKLVVSYDEEGKDLIRTINCTDKQKRYGLQCMTGEDDKYIYITFKPGARGISYNEMYFFETVAVSFLYKMGYTENPNGLFETPEYTIEYVGAYDAVLDPSENIDDFKDALAGVTDDDFDSIEDETISPDDEATTSPETSESGAIYAIIFAFILAAGFVLVFGKTKKQEN